MDKLIPTGYQGQRILTTAQLAEAYGTDEKRISENFNRNQERYSEGKHYFALHGEHLKEFKKAYPQIAENLKFAPILYLWTEKGAWFHAKSLNTDKAWEAYEMLVDDYYTVKALQPKLPQTYAEALRELADAWEENQRMLPKAEYFDALVERNLLTNFRDTAKELKVKEGVFIDWLLDHEYVYRDAAKKLKPYAQYVPDLFEIKEWGTEKKAGNQTLITPKGRETFRLLLKREMQPV
ncbi:MAG: phage antirepressor KilAC domain-containing protein [Ruminiclostridium sp.]